MSDTPINYGHSPTPQGRFVSSIDPDKAISVDDRGGMQYATGAQSGHVEIIVPALPGSPNGEERLLAKDFGPFVASKIESAFTRQPYLRSGATQDPAVVFSHYVGAAEGSGLIDSPTIGRMKAVAKEFQAEPEREEYFRQVLKPYLYSFTPRRR